MERFIPEWCEGSIPGLQSAGTDWSAMEELPKSAEPQHEKPLLTVEEQIAHLKAKGITFDLCGEAEEATILTR